MKSPRMYTTVDELKVIRRRLNEHEWYARALTTLRAPGDELIRRGIDIPKVKGFVFYETCPKDNTRLYQGPFEPDNVYCPKCGTKYTEEPYYRAWVWFYHLYLAQRCREMGVVYQVTRDDSYANAIGYVLKFYAENYEIYPNEDCVLGPTRLFQSTYQEGLWLEALAGATDLVRDAMPDDEFRFVRDNLLLPSAAVVKDYDEGENNRQVMNNGGLLAAGLVCEDSALVEYALRGPHGWFFHLANKVGEDGLWYEGDNYHFASLPSMTNMADAMARNGENLFLAKSGERTFKMMYDAPMLGLYPDLTFPARKDSAYGSQAAQRWYAGLYEVAFNRYRDPAYGRFLAAMYAKPEEEGPLRSAAGAIDVQPPIWARRDRLDWRGFLNAVTDLPTDGGLPVNRSLNMTGTGLGIMRQEGGRTYASLDYGHYGGGHGHPDRMQINFYAGGKRWLTDWGTGNYFLKHLRWYRSTIGHNTVVVDGRTQMVVDGTSRRFGVTDGAQISSGQVENIYPGVTFKRTALLLSPTLLFDIFEVDADAERRLDWALHPWGEMTVEAIDGALSPAALTGEHYEWLENVHAAPASGTWRAVCRHEGDALGIHMLGAPGTQVYTAQAYGAPNKIPDLFPVLVAQRTAAKTSFVSLYEHRAGEAPVVESFRQLPDGGYEVRLLDGTRYLVTYDAATAAASVVRHDAGGQLVEASGFGLKAIDGVFEADFPLDEAYVQVSGEKASLSLPERYGRLRLALPATEVTVNGQSVHLAGREVRQAPRAWASLNAGRVYSGITNAVTLTLCNYTEQPLAGALQLRLPEGWSLSASPASVSVASFSSATYALQFTPGPTSGEIQVGLTGDNFTVKPQAPVAVEAWAPNGQGAVVRVQATNRTGELQRVTVSAGGVAREVQLEGTQTLDFPVTWTDGPFVTEVAASCGSFKAVAPINTRVALLGQEHRIESASQIRRAERHWRGPQDLSATFRVDREGENLRLSIRVTDDTLKLSGSVEKHFDYDSVQVYFDPRPDRERKNPYLNGVYGLVLVPASPAGEPDRIFPIGPVESTLISPGMAVPSVEGVELKSTRRDDGYDLDVRIPVARLGCDPKPGDKLGFDLVVNDNDGTFRRSLQGIWTGAGRGAEARIYLRQDYLAPQRYGMLVF